VQYNGSIYIPCRFDGSRAFRPESLKFQELNANEHVLELPPHIDVRPNDKLTLVQPIEYAIDGDFYYGLDNWTFVPLPVTDEAEHRPPGVWLNVTDVTSYLAQSFPALEIGSYATTEVVAELRSGTLRLNTPAGTKTQDGPYFGKLTVSGTTTDQNLIISSDSGAMEVLIARVSVLGYRQHRSFEARRISDASEFDITTEVLVTELEFQYSDD